MDELIELIQCSKNGDISAFTKLVHMIENDLYRVAQTRLDNIDDITDAIQETLIKAYQSINTLEKVESFRIWIIKILINECNKLYNHNKKHLFLLKKLEKYDYTEEYINNIKFEELEDNFKFEEKLKLLNYKERICLILFYNGDYSVAEIADILGSNFNTVKSRIARAKRKIEKYITGGANNE